MLSVSMNPKTCTRFFVSTSIWAQSYLNMWLVNQLSWNTFELHAKWHMDRIESGLFTIAMEISHVVPWKCTEIYVNFHCIYSFFPWKAYYLSDIKNRTKRKWQPVPVFLPGKCHERRSLAGCRPWNHIKSPTQLSD